MAFTDFSDKHLFFDLDRTLWDFDRNSETTIRQILKNENNNFEFKIDISKYRFKL